MAPRRRAEQCRATTCESTLGAAARASSDALSAGLLRNAAACAAHSPGARSAVRPSPPPEAVATHLRRAGGRALRDPGEAARAATGDVKTASPANGQVRWWCSHRVVRGSAACLRACHELCALRAARDTRAARQAAHRHCARFGVQRWLKRVAHKRHVAPRPAAAVVAHGAGETVWAREACRPATRPDRRKQPERKQNAAAFSLPPTGR